MINFAAKQIGVSVEEATKLRKERMPIYGTSLGWLSAEHGLTDIQGFFAAVHPENEIEELDFDPKLRGFLQNLPLPMTILTNSPTIHANRVLDFFNIKDLFIFITPVEISMSSSLKTHILMQFSKILTIFQILCSLTITKNIQKDLQP